MKPKSASIGRRQNDRDRAYLEREKPVEIVEAGEDKPRATSSAPCVRCEVPGFRGCKHQRPYKPLPHQQPAAKAGRRRTFIEKRGK